MADPVKRLVTEQPVAVQRGAEMYAGAFQRPNDPWEDKTTWTRVLDAKQTPRFVVPHRAVAGMNQTAHYLQLGLVEPGQVVLDGYTWTGIPELPGFTLYHAKGNYAWLMVVEDGEFDRLVREGAITHEGVEHSTKP